MGDEPRAGISAKWEFERFEGLITRNPHRPRSRSFWDGTLKLSHAISN